MFYTVHGKAHGHTVGLKHVTEKVKLFYSYCHDDEAVLDRIRRGTKVVIENANVEEWWDRKLRGSDNLDEEIETALGNAHVVVMLLSDAYLSSASCKREMEYALEENKSGRKLAVPVVIRECGWREVGDLKKIVAIPRDGKALVKWKPVDDGIANIREAMKAVFEKAKSEQQSRDRYTRFLQRIKEIEFISQKKRDVELNEVFVFPNMSLEMEESSQDIHNFGELWECGNKILLMGEQRSGKTTLCHKIALDLTEKGEGVLIVQHERQVEKKEGQWIKGLCKDQILGGHRRWRKFAKRTLIFDNAEARTDFGFLASAEREFGRIIIATEEEDYICGLSTHTALAEYVVVRMSPLKHGQQEELIRKWLAIGGEGEIEDHRVDRLERDVNLIIQENRIVPRFPFFVLSILQTYEALMPQRMDITAYGHCYQALITAQLAAEGIEAGDIDSAHKVLTEIAYAVFERTEHFGVPSVKLTDFLEVYTDEYIVRPSVVERLHKGGRLLRLDDDGECTFKYGFVYYFFLGKYIAGNYLRAKSIIERLCEHSYRRENAYTLIFTAHHTTDEDLIDTILINTMLATGDRKEATLEKEETEVLVDALSSIPKKIAKSHSDVRKNRREEREARDREEQQQEAVEEEDLGTHDIYRSLKNMDILGQILRNRYGSLKKKKIEEIAEAITGSGLCLVGDFISPKKFRALEKFSEESAKHPGKGKRLRETEEVLRRRLGRELRVLCFALVTLLIGRIVYAIEKPEVGPVITNLCKRKENVAHRIIEGMFRIRTRGIMTDEDIGQIDAIIQDLDENGNEVAKRIFSILSQLYLSTHKVRYDHRQRVMGVLKVEYSPNKRKQDR